MNYALQYQKFWLGYFVLFVVMLVLNTVYDAFANFGSAGALSVIGTVLAVLGLRPLYGYARQRRYDPRWLWKTLFVFYAVVVLFAALNYIFVAVSKVSVVPVFYFAAFFAFGGPYLLALHQYVYRSPHLWA